MMATRLDQLLTNRGLVPSRARARDAIRRGHVRVDGKRLEWPGVTVAETALVEIDDPVARFVSRAAVKLDAALDHFSFDPAGKIAIDLGASTGGFTQLLLERGASRVHAIDVGHGQMSRDLASDPRVHLLERTNARSLSADLIGDRIGVLVSDLSFISQLALPPALAICSPKAFAVVLAKPQFEVGPGNIGKGGVVRDPEIARQAAEDLATWLAGQEGWRVLGVIPAPIAGGDGNQEYLIGAIFD